MEFEIGNIILSIAQTILRGIVGILLAGIVAAAFAFLAVRFKWLFKLAQPVLSVMRSVPVVSFILLALIYLHREMIPLLIAFLMMFPLLAENLAKGLLNLQTEPAALAKVFGIKGKNKFWHIQYPQLKPYVFSGLSSAMGFGWRAIIMGEVLAQTVDGIGSRMKEAQAANDTVTLLVWTLAAILISYLFDKGIGRLEKLRPPLFYPSVVQSIERESYNLSLSDISFAYKDKVVLQGITRRFEPMTIYGISGPSGCGKTTLLKLAAGLLQPDCGSVKGIPSGGTAFVFQDTTLLPHLTALENIMLPLTNSFYSKDKAKEIAYQTLEAMRIAACKDSLPSQLSYGQQQRIAIARALAFPSPVLLMDEPFKGLDETLVHSIIAYIREQQALAPRTIIFTTHKPKELEMLADETEEKTIFEADFKQEYGNNDI